MHPLYEKRTEVSSPQISEPTTIFALSQTITAVFVPIVFKILSLIAAFSVVLLVVWAAYKGNPKRIYDLAESLLIGSQLGFLTIGTVGILVYRRRLKKWKEKHWSFAPEELSINGFVMSSLPTALRGIYIGLLLLPPFLFFSSLFEIFVPHAGLIILCLQANGFFALLWLHQLDCINAALQKRRSLDKSDVEKINEIAIAAQNLKIFFISFATQSQSSSKSSSDDWKGGGGGFSGGGASSGWSAPR